MKILVRKISDDTWRTVDIQNIAPFLSITELTRLKEGFTIRKAELFDEVILAAIQPQHEKFIPQK